MRGFKGSHPVGVAVTALAAPATASATTPTFNDVSASVLGAPADLWAVGSTWVPAARDDNTFSPAAPASRYTAARVLAEANQKINQVAMWTSPYNQAL